MKKLNLIGYQLYIIIYILSKRVYTQKGLEENPENNNIDVNNGTTTTEEEHLPTTEIILWNSK